MDPLLIPLAAITIPIIVVPVAILSRQARRARELDHIERMRGLELGHGLPQKDAWWTASRIVVLIAGIVPIWAMGLAGFIDWFGGARQELWEASAIVAAVGVLCGTYLATRHLFPRPTVDAPTLKPQYDPDAFDVVSSRG